MGFAELVKAALELGVVPALSLFLVAAMYFQNRQLLKDRRDAELQLLQTLGQMVKDNQRMLERVQGQLGRRPDAGE
jgi:hypothetical protein